MPVAVSLILNGILWATILLDKHLWHISKHLELMLDHSHLDNEVFEHAISQHAQVVSPNETASTCPIMILFSGWALCEKKQKTLVI